MHISFSLYTTTAKLSIAIIQLCYVSLNHCSRLAFALPLRTGLIMTVIKPRINSPFAVIVNENARTIALTVRFPVCN